MTSDSTNFHEPMARTGSTLVPSQPHLSVWQDVQRSIDAHFEQRVGMHHAATGALWVSRFAWSWIFAPFFLLSALKIVLNLIVAVLPHFTWMSDFSLTIDNAWWTVARLFSSIVPDINV